MIRRPKPGEGEEDILRMQEEFLREKGKNKNLLPAAQVVNLRCMQPTKRANTSADANQKQSKYAQKKGLKSSIEKKPRIESSTGSVIGDILEKTFDELPDTNKASVTDEKSENGDDKVYFPKIIPSLLGSIVEKNIDSVVEFDEKPMPPQGFPVATKRDPSCKLEKKIRPEPIQKIKTTGVSDMNIDQPTCSKTGQEHPLNIPAKSFILQSKESQYIHQDNVEVLNKMTEKEILEEQQKLLTNLDPKIIEFLKAKRKHSNDCSVTNKPQNSIENKETEAMDTTTPTNEPIDNDSLWENDVLSHPLVHKWLHFDSLEKDKLEWMKGIEESKAKYDEPYEARFNFKGYLLPFTMEYTETTKTLYHHGDEPNRPGYTLSELFELSRSTIMQQRVIALNTLAGILEYFSAGTYKDILELPLSKIFFIIRIAIDENKIIILEPALQAMRNLIYNRIDEASLDALLGFDEGNQQPCLENDKSEIEELNSKASELKDFHLAEIDIIAALLRMDILQRIYYILETVKPSFNCIQYSLQILTRLSRDSIVTATQIVETDHLMQTVVRNFIPATSINFLFNPQLVYNGKPVLAAMKFLRVLSLQSKEISEILVSRYGILMPLSQYISSGVDGTYGLRIQLEAFCILSNLLHFGIGIENARALAPIVVTALYKHTHGTDLFVYSSVISATHAAVVLQFVNKFMNCNFVDLESYKHQIYPLIKEGVQKWLAQLSQSESYTCGHLRLLCAALDCCKTMLIAEKLPMKFLNDSLKLLSTSTGFKEIVKNLVLSSNLLSGIENKDLHLINNLMSLGGSVINSTQNVLPILNVTSSIPFLASLFKLLTIMKEKELSLPFLESITRYLSTLANKMPCLCDNWFTRIETEFVFDAVVLSTQSEIPECKKDLLYTVASKLCYILRVDKKYELEFIFNYVVFNKQWYTAERLLNIVSLSDAEGFSKALSSIEEIKQCYFKVMNLNYKDIGPTVVLKKWQEPILPRDWIYLPILSLYSQSQEVDTSPRVVGEHANKMSAQLVAQKAMIIICSLEWILFNELCFPDLLNDIDITDRLCRIMCVFLCDNSLFLDPKIKTLLLKCTQILFKKKKAFNFDKPLIGLHNFQDFYTQFLEQFQSVSYGDHTFAACVLVPLAQRHNVKWRKLLWSEYAGCLRALDCPEDLLCYELNDYFYPQENDESLLKSYVRALASNLLRPDTLAHKIAKHHVEVMKRKSNKN